MRGSFSGRSRLHNKLNPRQVEVAQQTQTRHPVARKFIQRTQPHRELPKRPDRALQAKTQNPSQTHKERANRNVDINGSRLGTVKEAVIDLKCFIRVRQDSNQDILSLSPRIQQLNGHQNHMVQLDWFAGMGDTYKRHAMTACSSVAAASSRGSEQSLGFPSAQPAATAINWGSLAV